MKIMRAFLVVSLLAAVTAMAGPITLKVDLKSQKKEETKGTQSKYTSKNSGMPERVITDTRQLEISLGNTSTREFPNLKVVYYVFAKDVKEKEIVLAKKHDKSVAVTSLGKGSFTSEPVVMTQHSMSSKTVAGTTKTTPASGFKYAGYGVQVFAGNELLAEMFDPPELKASTGLPETPTVYDEEKWKKKKAK